MTVSPSSMSISKEVSEKASKSFDPWVLVEKKSWRNLRANQRQITNNLTVMGEGSRFEALISVGEITPELVVVDETPSEVTKERLPKLRGIKDAHRPEIEKGNKGNLGQANSGGNGVSRGSILLENIGPSLEGVGYCQWDLFRRQ